MFHGGNPIGRWLEEPALEAGELCWPLAVVSRSVPARGALAAGVHSAAPHEHAAPPPGLIFNWRRSSNGPGIPEWNG